MSSSESRNVYPIHFALWAPYAPPRGLPKQVVFHLAGSNDDAATNNQSLVKGLLGTASSTSTTFKKAVSVVHCTPAETHALRTLCEFDEETFMRPPLPPHFLTLPIVSNPVGVDDLEEDDDDDTCRRGFLRDTLRSRYRERETAKEAYLMRRCNTEGNKVCDDGFESLMEKMDVAVATHLSGDSSSSTFQPAVAPGSSIVSTMGSCKAVLQGAYGCVDDCSNMLPNATLYCESIRDIWRLLQQSEKIATDMAHQRSTASELIWARGPAILGKAYDAVEADPAAVSDGVSNKEIICEDTVFRLSRMESVPESCDYRAFVLVSPEGSTYLGACQKRVEVVYDAHRDSTFEDRRTASNCIERAMSRLFDSGVSGSFASSDEASPVATTIDVDSSSLLSTTTTLTEKLNLLLARQLFGSAPSSLLVGVDISFESPSLPLYTFGMSAIPLTAAEADVFTKPSLYPQEPMWKSDRVPFCRLFRTLDQLRAMYRRSEGMATGDAAAEGDDDAPCNDPFLMFVAMGKEDVFGDIKLVTNHQQYNATGDANQHQQLKIRIAALELKIRAIRLERGLPVSSVSSLPPVTGNGDEAVGALVKLMQQVVEKEGELDALQAEN